MDGWICVMYKPRIFYFVFICCHDASHYWIEDSWSSLSFGGIDYQSRWHTTNKNKHHTNGHGNLNNCCRCFCCWSCWWCGTLFFEFLFYSWLTTIDHFLIDHEIVIMMMMIIIIFINIAIEIYTKKKEMKKKQRFSMEQSCTHTRQNGRIFFLFKFIPTHGLRIYNEHHHLGANK